jgi:hypothetical protein
VPFTITATNRMGAVSFARDTAVDALNKCLELQKAGFQAITVKDEKGRELTQDQLIHLSSPEKSP